MGVASFETIQWDDDSRRELSMHSVHQYPAKFPAFIVTKAIEYAKSLGIDVRLMADVFCGCGTSALEAKLYGLDFYGIDIDPVAVLIAKAKSNIYDIDVLRDKQRQILHRLKEVSAELFLPSEMKNDRILYWFDIKTTLLLSLLKRSIEECTESGSIYREAFMCVFSSILKPCSRWLAKSIKPQVDPNKIPKDPIVLFERQTKLFIMSAEAFSRQVPSLSTGGSAVRIERKDVLTLESDIKTDLIVSSPPYATSYEYADLHQLSALWLGYAEDYRTLREGSIGSSYNTSKVFADPSGLNEVGRGIVQSLMAKGVPDARIKSLVRYYHDMEMVATRCYSCLNSGGLLIFVVGDTRLKGVELNNSDHFVEALRDAGFSDVRKVRRKISGKILTPYRQENGRFAHSDSGNAVYKSEYVIMGRKHARDSFN